MACLAALLGLLNMAVQAWADEVVFRPSIAVRGDYNDNVFFSTEDEREDFRTTLIAGVEYRNRTERRTFKLDAAVSPFFYRDHDDLDDTDVHVFAEAGYLLTSRLKANLDGFFRIDNQPDRDVDLTGLVFGIGTDERYRYHGGVSTDYAVLENHTLSLSYAYDQDDWRAGEAERQDFQGHTVGLQYRYDVSRFLEATQLLLSAGYGIYDYDTAELKSAYATLGLQRMLSEIFRFNAGVGARYSDTQFTVQRQILVPPGIIEVRDVTLSNDVWGGIVTAGLDYLGERTRWNITAYHDLRTAGGARGASRLTRLIFNNTHRLAEKLAIGFFTGYYVNRADADEFTGREQDDRTFNLRPFLRWLLSDKFTLEGAYHYTHVEDEVAGSTAERNTFYVQVSYGYDLMD